ncbi:TPA: hypothetical protein ACNPAX_003433 [Salmonella enterica subsp. enterica serovar Typhimurium]|uniref:Morphogenetic protein n=2 Tax=Enterobacteriaceae TaxID=543 RepID=A0AAV1IUZ4_ECOLX|nr:MULTISPECIES: hypothetical protein [Enterobacteriaceae]EBV0104966.1 hypothetical protein [Salmonella enterica subsp. enterica serovar Derby]ECN5873725.1 hypothetical protein [Salmonella enterica subsp. enterica serovar Typhimurium]EDB0580016.1 hypothetical protein [Salmonella enterica subsp. enterica]EEI8633205.1 hypothetical protein [Salmonella enterica subsp. enterica serovar 4,[5],12:i:-]HCZ2148532.1 hypothetical protein [Salmonella enterica subsp. enterica serovar 1,4,[5],12:i:-]
MAQKEMTTLTTAYLQQLVFFAGEATCHPDANYLLEFERLASPGIVLELAQQVLALRQKEQHESNTCRLNFEQWLEQQRGKIDVDCGCVSTETFMHWLRVAYEAGNHPDFPDSSQQSPKKSVKTTLERGYLEAALKIKPGHTLGVIDAMLVHEMAKALLPLVADKIPNKADI